MVRNIYSEHPRIQRQGYNNIFSFIWQVKRDRLQFLCEINVKVCQPATIIIKKPEIRELDLVFCSNHRTRREQNKY